LAHLFGATTFSISALSLMTLRITKLSLMTLNTTKHDNAKLNVTQDSNTNAKLSMTIEHVFQSVVVLGVAMLSAVAPLSFLQL
jgi:hypothetical protein